MSKNEAAWGDEELYESLSQPVTKEVSEVALRNFTEGVEQLRRQCGIPDVVLACTVYLKDENGERLPSPIQLMSLGHSDVSTELGAVVFRKYTLPLIQRGEQLRAASVGEEPVT